MRRISTFSIALMFLVIVVYAKSRPRYTFILPDGYIGWVQVVFGDPEASPAYVRKDAGREIRVPESGVARMSGFQVMDFKNKDEFYYRISRPNGEFGLSPVPDCYLLPGPLHGGFTVAGTAGRGSGGGSWFLFIGPPEIRANFPDADSDKVIESHTSPSGKFTRIMAPETYPTPGRVPIHVPISP